MDLLEILAVLNDLPDTFKRQGPPYTQLIDAFGFALATYTLGADATFDQTETFLNATGDWLDIWGLLFNVPRNQNEADSSYRAGIQTINNAWVGTVPA